MEGRGRVKRLEGGGKKLGPAGGPLIHLVGEELLSDSGPAEGQIQREVVWEGKLAGEVG